MTDYHFLSASPLEQSESLQQLWRTWRTAEKIHLPCLCLAPTQSYLNQLKHLLIQAELNLFNVHFLTPSSLREWLRAVTLPTAQPLLGREEYEFLLRETARPLTDAYPLCSALTQHSAGLRSALDELMDAGYPASILREHSLAPEGLAAWLEAWERVRAQIEPDTRAQRDRDILRNAQTTPRQIILLGFATAQIASFTLLEAALRVGTERAIFTLLPHAGAEDLWQPWLQWVERVLPTAQTGELEETTDVPDVAPEVRFYLAPDQHRQAELIVRQVHAWSHEASREQRIGLVFPADSALVSAVAAQLRRLDLAFSSEFSTPLPLRFEQSLLVDWLQLQRDGLQAEPFLQFWRKAANVEAFTQQLGSPVVIGAAMEKLLHRAFQQTLSDEVPVLHAWLQQEPTDPALPTLSAFLELWSREGQWAEEASLADYFVRFSGQLDFLVGPHLGGQVRHFLENQLQRLATCWPVPVPRAEAARLILEFVQRPETTRDYSRWSQIQLLTPESAQGLPWDYLLLAQVEEGVWPAAPRTTSLVDDSFRLTLNRAAQIPAPHGGEELVYPPHLRPLLTQGMRYRCEREHFSVLQESVTHELVLVAAVSNEINGAQEVYPSEFWRAAWSEHHGTEWNKKTQTSLLAIVPEPTAPTGLDSARIQAMREAQATRRDPAQPFGAWQFCAEPAPTRRGLAAKAAEEILRDPASAWFKHGLQVSTERNEWKLNDYWAIFQGTLLHRLVQSTVTDRAAHAEGWPLLSEPESWAGKLSTLVHQRQQRLQRAFAESGLPYPTWWQSEWPRLHCRAEQLLQNLLAVRGTDFGYGATEYDLKFAAQTEDNWPRNQSWRGRADLVLLDHSSPRQAQRVLIIDFKTGTSAETFDLKELQTDGTYFQLLLYAAIWQTQFPSATIYLAVVPPKFPKKNEASVVEAFGEAMQPLWQGLEAAWVQGFWGQSKPLHDRFNSSNASHLPIATLEIPLSVLEAKWAATPQLAAWPSG